jgi:aspartate aminotransferase-like enzyme
MNALLPNIDPDGLMEFSVVYTDRALNHMSKKFQKVMNEINRMLKKVYNAKAAVLVPGSGTYGMEAIARQFCTGKKALVIRDGFFSFRWTQIFEAGSIPSSHTVLKAIRTSTDKQSPWVPTPIAEVVAAIAAEKPDVVIAPHVETAAGIILPNDYLIAVAKATHAAGGIFVLDCVASGCVWVDMEAIGVDVIVTAPQKGWSGSPCCAMVMLSEKAMGIMEGTTSTSFSADLKKWSQIMDAFLKGGHAYHATMPTDALAHNCAVMQEMEAYGFDKLQAEQQELGTKVRALLAKSGLPSLAAKGFEAPGVVVCYTTDPEVQSGKKFLAAGLQIASGVPLKCDEPADFMTFRLGLFGLDKLHNVDRTVEYLATALKQIGLR